MSIEDSSSHNFHLENVLSSHALVQDERRRRFIFPSSDYSFFFIFNFLNLFQSLQQLDDCVKSVMENVWYAILMLDLPLSFAFATSATTVPIKVAAWSAEDRVSAMLTTVKNVQYVKKIVTVVQKL